MELIAPPKPSLYAPSRREHVPAAAFLGGVLVSQIANSALHLAQPLLVAHLTGSLGKAALFSSFDTAVHMGGTALGGWPADRLGARRLLILSTFLRAASLALIPAAWIAGRLTPFYAMTAFTLDAFVRGFLDTAVHALPLELGQGERAELDRLNARYELAFDLGGVAGPLILGALMLSARGVVPHLAVPAGFALAALIYAAIPERRRWSRPSTEEPRGGTAQGLKLVLRDGRLLWACLGLTLLNLYPLRKLLSAFFAKALLGQPATAGWLGAAFGLGGVAGSLIYARYRRRSAGAGWIAAGAVGTLLLAAGWIPGSLWAMMAAAFLFALGNVGGRLALTTRLQEATPLEVAGGVTAVARFGANLASVVLKALVGAAFMMGASPRVAFAVVGAGLALIAVLQSALAWRTRT